MQPPGHRGPARQPAGLTHAGQRLLVGHVSPSTVLEFLTPEKFHAVDRNIRSICVLLSKIFLLLIYRDERKMNKP